MSNDFDVIVVGGGGAGMAAAIRAREQGASVVIVEADTKLGGATAQSSGVVYAAGTSVQRALGIEDTPEAMYRYMMTLNQWALRPQLVRILCEGSAPAVEWLIELGNDFPVDWLVESGVEGVKRGHATNGSGASIANVLSNAAGAAGVETALGSRVEKLLVEDGRVVGIGVDGMDLRGGAVVVTTGGFGNNFALLERLYPTAAFHGDRVFSVYHEVPFNMGDGILFSEKVGARVTGIDSGLLNPSTGFGKFIEAFVPYWTMLVNLEGRRFMAETAPYTVSGYLMNDQTKKQSFAIFDDPTLVECGDDLKGLQPYKSSVGSPTWYGPMIRDQIKKGRVKVGQTIAELAAQTGIDPAALAATIERYNADCDRGEDSEFLKKAPKLYPVRQAPFYAVEVCASLVGSTHAGLDITHRCEVLDEGNRVIPGLYAGGEVLGCTLGRRYVGGGISLCNAMVFGSIAGTKAARDAIGRR